MPDWAAREQSKQHRDRTAGMKKPRKSEAFQSFPMVGVARIELCDPYDVNAMQMAQMAVFCGFLEIKMGNEA